ncbi:MAG: methylenetetrahydrofolate reductase [Clostridiales Family XIII bacterium]|nr:methylenetetrahydrofolate reductase [Clostridiales Family XIII bacterium]
MEETGEKKSRLQRLFEAGTFVVTGEVGPPMGADADHVYRAAEALNGVTDAANVTDNQASVLRMSSIAASLLVQRKGIEAVVQMTCRDRNRIAIQSDLLGAWALGLRNLLVLSGDHQSFGNDGAAKNVYDVDSVQLLKMLSDLQREGVFHNGKKAKGVPGFFIGATANPFADPAELQLIRLKKKIHAGAAFIQTQSVYNVDKFEAWMEKVRGLGLHEQAYIEAGIVVNKSLRSIEMTRRVPGMDIPDALVERMRRAEDAKEEGVRIALEIIGRVKGIKGVSGLHIMAVGWEEIVPEVVRRAGFLPRPAPI